ncbi:MAG: TRAP transporter fused permease subunit [Desulfobacteraceae bacterium]|nr:TRAP transporter fused permease subunit [Desulfobacteraceae bacterium]
MKEPPKQVDVELTRYEGLPKYLKVLFLVLSIGGIALAVYYHFFNVSGMVLIDFAYYYLMLAAYCACGFLILPASKRDRAKGVVPWYDLVAAVLAFGIAIYFFSNSKEITLVGWHQPTPLNLALACIFCLLVVEAGRRSAGPIYIAFAAIIGLYPLYAGHMPGMLFGQSYSFTWLMGFTTFTAEGLVGIPAWLCFDILIGFLLLAGMLIASGGGRFFLNLALALLGRFRGGPAKVSVVSSAFFGSLSGSAISNIVATGSVTIPTMKRLGYPSHYAGAIEACASTGGTLMPPVMGAAAFIVCAFLGIEYAVVIAAAFIPSLLFYFGLLMQIDSYAAKVGLKGLPREEIPSLKTTLKEGWQFIAVLVFLLWGLLYMRWEAMAPYYAAGMLVLLSFTTKKARLTPRKLVEAFAMIGKLITQVVAMGFPIGFIICGLVITGVSGAFTAQLVALGGEQLWLILLMGIISCYILGMAGIAIPAYIFLAVTMAPAVILLGGLNTLAVHLLILYYAMMSMITPPVAMGAFVAAAMAGASPMKTAWTAMRLGIVLYFIPLFFVFNPALILQGSILESVYLFVLCLLGIALLAGGLEGYLVKVGRIRGWARLPLVIAGLLIAFPEWKTTVLGAILAALTLGIILIQSKIAAKELAITQQSV